MHISGTRSLGDLLAERAEQFPDKQFLVFEAQDGVVRTLTYRQFHEQSNQLAHGLRRAGLKAGDRVVVHLVNSPEFLITWFGLAKVGVIIVPTNTMNTPVEMAYVLRFAEVSAVVTDSVRFSVIEEALKQAGGIAPAVYVTGIMPEKSSAESWDALWQGFPTDFPRVRLPEGALAEILFTSGTTAEPKGVELTHAHCLWSGEHTAKATRMSPEDRNLTSLPLFHVNAQTSGALAALTGGATLVLLEKYSATKFWAQVRSHRATVVSLVSAMLRTILLQPTSQEDNLHAVRLINYSINCTDQEKAQFEERFNVRLTNGYGLSEALTIVASGPLVGPARWPAVGLPALDREVRIIDEEGADVPAGSVGQIIVGGTPGKTIFRGYHKNPEATSKALVDGWLHTGDQGWFDEEGYLHFFDRKKDVIKRGGENVSTSEVERVLMRHPGVLECAVIGVPDPIKDQAVLAYIALRPGVSLGKDELMAFCAGHLARFKVPSIIEFRDSLPKTSVGKIAKKLLR